MRGHIRNLWIATLFAAEEIPFALITFVAMLIFLHEGLSATEVTLQSSILFMPWVLKSWMRSYVKRAGNYRRWIQVAEVLITLSLGALAFALPHGKWWTLASLMAISLLCAWHELLARMYYERMLRPEDQRRYNSLKTTASQMAVVLTYGLVIIAVGILQIYFRERRFTYSWSLGMYITSGIFMLFMLLHLLILRRPVNDREHPTNTVGGSIKAELHVIERIRQRPLWWRHLLALQLMLIPQGLLFFTRTIFLMDSPRNGGLGCTLQEVGFAQGTVGVIAFLSGMGASRWLMNNIPQDKLRSLFAVSLGLSPFVYLFMTFYPPQSLMPLSIATFQAQLFFGFGLGACRADIRYISGERYRNTVNILYVPLISMCMLIPMAISGWLIEHLDYQTFFTINAATSILAWTLIPTIPDTARQQDR